jgi:hypothetical protein
MPIFLYLQSRPARASWICLGFKVSERISYAISKC